MSALQVEEKQDVLRVYLTDTKIMDEARIREIGNELMEKADEAAATESKNMLLNFQGVSFMSSAMIGKLVMLNKRAKHNQVNLKFCRISPNLLEVFKVTRLNRVFDIDDDAWPEHGE